MDIWSSANTSEITWPSHRFIVRFNKNYLTTRRQTLSEKKILRIAIILVQGHRFIDKGERFGNKDPSTETECHELSYSHPMKYTGYGVEDFHCQDRGRTTNIFKWISSKFKIDIDTVGQLLRNVETSESQTNEWFKTLANAFGDLKITSTEVKYQKSTQRTNVYTPLFHISGKKTIPLRYNTSARERFLRSESDFHTEFRGKVYRASDLDTTLSGEIKQLLQLQKKVEKINLVKVEGKKG